MNEKTDIRMDGVEEAIELLEDFFRTQKDDKSYELVAVRLRSFKKQLWEFLIVYPGSAQKQEREIFYFEETYVVSVPDKIVKMLSE